MADFPKGWRTSPCAIASPGKGESGGTGMRNWILALALVLAPASAQAEWLEASSAHFVVYADDSERDVRRFSEQLERFHAAMEIVTGLEGEPPSPSNRVTVFMVRNQRQVERLAGDRN